MIYNIQLIMWYVSHYLPHDTIQTAMYIFGNILFVMSSCDFVTFPCGVLGQVWYLIVLIPDLCCLPYLEIMSKKYLKINTTHAGCSYYVLQRRSQTAEKVTHIKGRLQNQAKILCNCIPFQMGISLKGKNLRTENYFYHIKWPPLNVTIYPLFTSYNRRYL